MEFISVRYKTLFFFIAAVLMIIISVCANANSNPNPNPNPSNTQWILEPATSFGAFCIGQDIGNLEKIMGKNSPDLKKQVQNGFLIKYEKAGIIAQYNSYTRKIQFIGCDRQSYNKINYQTREGITIGTSRTAVENAYFMPTRVIPSSTRDFYPVTNEIALYIDKGIAFHYDMNNKVVVIIVFDPSLFGGRLDRLIFRHISFFFTP